jgi:1-acyl-sn-glycerol-3-phosphate acyltransferase
MKNQKNQNQNKKDSQRIIYYSDELSEEFSTAQINPKKIDENFDYGNAGFKWKALRLFWYRIVFFPWAMLFLKLHEGNKVVNKKVLKKVSKNQGIFIFGNHTNAIADAFIPSKVSFPRSTYVIVHPNNVSMPVLGKITPYLGAIPLPDTITAAKNFMNVIKLRCEQNASVVIYPEAHIWPYYTKIRPFTDLSFRYPVQNKCPVFCFTNTYQKRRFSKKPKMITYVDGPFYADETLKEKEQRKQLRDKVYETMCERSKLNEVELIKYIRK